MHSGNKSNKNEGVNWMKHLLYSLLPGVPVLLSSRGCALCVADNSVLSSLAYQEQRSSNLQGYWLTKPNDLGLLAIVSSPNVDQKRHVNVLIIVFKVLAFFFFLLECIFFENLHLFKMPYFSRMSLITGCLHLQSCLISFIILYLELS